MPFNWAKLFLQVQMLMFNVLLAVVSKGIQVQCVHIYLRLPDLYIDILVPTWLEVDASTYQCASTGVSPWCHRNSNMNSKESNVQTLEWLKRSGVLSQ